MTSTILKKEGIKDFTKDIQTMTRKELIEHFSFKGSKKINFTLLMKNLIWQTYTWIKQGKVPPIEGNIRSFWYQNVKPVLSRLGVKLSGTKYTEKVYDTFVEMVTRLRLFKYKDFGFLDERGHARVVGRIHGNLILFVEKDGLFGLVRRLALQHDATGIALGGFPSYLTTEFLIHDMTKLDLLKQPVRLFSIVDYDPSGYWIEQEFAQQLKDLGVDVASVHALVAPKDLPGDLVEAYKYKLKKGAKTQNWLEATGGIGRDAFGLEADALGAKRIQEAFEKAVQPYLKANPMEILSHERKSLVNLLDMASGSCHEDMSLLNLKELADVIERLGTDELNELRGILKERLAIGRI